MIQDRVTLETVARSVETLERQNRQLKRICFGIVVILSGVAATQSLTPKAVAATRFTLVDEDNRTRAQLETSIPGSGRAGVNPILSFSDRDGRVRLRVGIGPRGATLEVVDENGKTHEYLGGPTVRPATQN